MRFSENRIVAWIVLAACVLLSIFGLGGFSLAGEREKILDVFYDGAEKGDTTRYSMDAYLDRAAECAQVMAMEAQLHLGSENAASARMMETLRSFGDDDSLDARYEAYQQLQKDSDVLYNEMYAAGLTDAKRVNFKTAYDDFWGSDKFIRRDAYRSMASDFNGSLKGFPASVVAALHGIEELNSFGG